MPRIYKRDLVALVLALAGAIALLLALLLGGCAARPLDPGTSSVRSPGFAAGLKQSANPAAASTQRTREAWDIGPGLPVSLPPEARAVPASGARYTRETETTIGAAQKDTAREIGAKLASLRGVQWLGAVVFLFGAASLAWPPLKALVGSVTTSGVLVAAGLALVFLPALLVGHELIILGVAAALAGAWMFAHRHGRLRGFIDANKDGIDDRLQP